MGSFWDILENLQSVNKISSGGDSMPGSKAVRVFEKAINPSNRQRDFWEVFKDLCSPPDALAELLGIDENAVVGFAAKIDAARAEAQRRQIQPTQGKRSEIIQTGNIPKGSPAESPQNMETPETRPIGT